MLRVFLFLIIVLATGTNASAGSILDQPDVVLRPLFTKTEGDKLTDWEQLKAKADPLSVTNLLFERLRQARHSKIAKQDAAVGLDMFLNHWPTVTRDGATYRWNYGYTYGEMAVGWWSGMDSFMAAAVLVGAHEIYHDEHYLTLARKVLASAIRSPEVGGSVWHDGDRCWISEYSWSGMTTTDESYVLNGHLYGLQALKMVADALDDEAAEDAFRCGVRGTETHVEKYTLPQWSLYMLHKPTIDPAHYLIFETSQFDAMYYLSGDSVFQKEAERRRRIFERQYPIYLDQNGDVVFAKTGAPHPYDIDIYMVTLSCILVDGSSWVVKEDPTKKRDQLHRSVLRYHPPAKPLSCSPLSLMGGRFPIPLYSAAPIIAGKHDRSEEILPSELSAAYDGMKRASRRVTIMPATVSASGSGHYTSLQARLELSGIFDLPNDKLFGIEINTERSSKIGIALIDEAGNSASRYYEPLKVGRQIILLSKLGFNGYEKLAGVRKISISIYTDEVSMPDQKSYDLTVGDVVTFPSPIAIESYFRDTGRTYPERR